MNTTFTIPRESSIEVIPAINCELHDGDAAVRKLRTAEQFAHWVHLDIADGVFTFQKSWGDPALWQELDPALKVEVHLMVEHPERAAPAWIAAGVSRVIVHYEAFPRTHANQERVRKHAFADIIERARHAGVSAMLAINPETTLQTVAPHLAHFDAFQVFSQAHPGPSGQKFLTSVLPKIAALREQFPDATIEVDGGVNLDTARIAAAAGANALVAGSYIFEDPDPRARYEELRALGADRARPLPR